MLLPDIIFHNVSFNHVDRLAVVPLYCLYFIGNENFLNGTTVTVLECSEGFYQENGSSVCTPSCYTWTQYSKELSLFLDAVSIIFTLIALLGALAVIIISCLVYKRM